MTMQKSVEHLQIIGKHDSWETPAEMLWDAMKEYKIFPKLDVCTTKSIAKRHKFKKFYTKTTGSGLKKEWKEDYFMNPPYSEIGSWMGHDYDQAFSNGVEGMILTYAKTDTQWWHMFVENNKCAEVHFIKGRIRFLQNGKKPKHSAPYPSCWIIFRIIRE